MSLTAWRILRFLLRPLVRVFYRVAVIGARNLPKDGPALLVCNHVSYVDSIILGYALERPPRFLIWRKFFDARFTGPLVRAFGAIPIAENDAPETIKTSLAAVVAALKAGEVVCLFPEGGMTRTGHVHGFKRGFELIARRAGVPITPVYMDGLWGSVFSFEGGRYFFKRPKRIPRPLTVAFGRPLPPDSSSAEVRRAVMDLGSDAFALRKRYQLPLHVQVLARGAVEPVPMAAAVHGRFDRAGADLGPVARRRADALALDGPALPRAEERRHDDARLGRRGADERGDAHLRPRADQPELHRRARLHRRRHPALRAEDGLHLARAPAADGAAGAAGIRLSRGRSCAACRAATGCCATSSRRSRRTRIAERLLMRRGAMDDLATVMFTSGATGEPKGVMLSHHNIVSNIEAFTEVMELRPGGHDDGHTPAVPFVRVHRHALDAADACACAWSITRTRSTRRASAAWSAKYRATVIAGTSSFFALYVRGCEPEQFRSLRLAVAGAQKLVPAVAEAFEARFGLPLTEGYGCTELSPVVSVNVPDVSDGPVKQIGARVGSVGRPLPGLGILVADRETLRPAAGSAPGVILVRGPSVMLRYMDDARATAAAMRRGPASAGAGPAAAGLVRDGGHRRGGRGRVPPHSRPRLAVQQDRRRDGAAHGDRGRPRRGLAGGRAQLRRGDAPGPRARGKSRRRLFRPRAGRRRAAPRMSERGMPNLWLPSPKDFHRVESLPFLPSGKLDLAATRRLAEAAAGAKD